MTFVSRNEYGVLTSDGERIPYDEGNADYRDYLAWVALGNSVPNLPFDVPSEEQQFFDNICLNASMVHGGTDGSFLYNNAGKLGERITTGSSAVVLNQGPLIANPTINTPTITGNLYVGDTPYQGDANSVLTATGTGVEWNYSSGTGDVVRNIAPTITDVILAGELEISGVGVGTSGQLLQSTGTGITWASATGSGNVVRATSPTITTPTIAKLANLTTNGFVKTSGSDGTLSVDTATYLQAMTYSNALVTTADLTGSLNTIHYLDVSGMTANRTFTMPTATAAGQRCTVFLSTGSASYVLIIALATNEYTRLFNSLECVSFISTGAGASAWILDVDKRIPCTARLTYTGASGQSFTSGSSTQVTLNSSSFETAGINDTTNSRLKIRRTGKYLLTGFIRLASITATIPRFTAWIRLTSSGTVLFLAEFYALSTTSAPGITVTGIADLTAGDTIDLFLFQNSGSAQSPASSTGYPTLGMTEIIL